jgi:small subunit ribosomal protein S16
MATVLRLARHGATHSPFYRVVATDHRNTRDGRFIEKLGTYNPLRNPIEVTLNWDRIDYWLSVGAKPSDTVSRLLKNFPRGYVAPAKAEKVVKAPTKRPAKEKAAVAAPAPVADAAPAEAALAPVAE